MTRKVIIDTNGLMIPGQFGVDIFSELKRLGYDSFLVPKECVKELEKIYARAHGKDKAAAKVALSLVDRCTIIDKGGFVDDIIVEMASETGAAVLTSDIELKKRLCSKEVTIVHLRERTHLSV